MLRTIRTTVIIAVLSATALVGVATPAGAGGVVQISGVGIPGSAACDDQLADYTIELSGDLVGCIYGTVTDFSFHDGGGTYNEWADEVFIGTWGDLEGSFEMTEHFTAKFTKNFEQVFGRCQHPIKTGSGEDDFEGISGRLDFKDDVEAGTADYRGHLKL